MHLVNYLNANNITIVRWDEWYTERIKYVHVLSNYFIILLGIVLYKIHVSRLHNTIMRARYIIVLDRNNCNFTHSNYDNNLITMQYNYSIVIHLYSVFLFNEPIQTQNTV